MRILRYEYQGRISYGCLEKDRIRKIQGDPVRAGGTGGLLLSEETLPFDDVRLLMPVESPRQIVAIGLNYKAHIEEFQRIQGVFTPTFPVSFMIAQSALTDPGNQVTVPFREHKTDYEAELVVVIGKETFEVSEADALSCVFGYTCGNDITDRDIQKQDQQWTRAKSYPGFKPFGPWIETELDPSGLQLVARVNDEIRQRGNTDSMIHSVPQLISKVSSFMKLYPGDLIFTGTPSGIGPLVPGDICEIEIEGIGVLRNLIS
jgi:2-keto-4-pentenoate hydratase/2-oxohepta-3-ene-1,7-dioic acid hydratase in catechol pathway